MDDSPSEAAPRFEKAVALYKSLNGGKVTCDCSKSLAYLGSVLRDLGDAKGVLKHFKASLKSVEEAVCAPKGRIKSGLKYCANSDVAAAYESVGVCLEEMGSFMRAKDFFKNADAIMARAGRTAPWN